MRSHWHVAYGCHLNVLSIFIQREKLIQSAADRCFYCSPQFLRMKQGLFRNLRLHVTRCLRYRVQLLVAWTGNRQYNVGSRTPNAVSSYPLTSDSTSVSYLTAP